MFWLFDHICIRQYLMELHCVANLISDSHLRMYIFDKEQSLYLYMYSYNVYYIDPINIQSLNVFFPEPVGNSLVKMFNTFVCDMSFEKVYS